MVSDRNFETNKPVNTETCALTGEFIILGHSKQSHISHQPYEFSTDLYDKSGNNTWWEHSVYGSKVDVVAILETKISNRSYSSSSSTPKS